MRGERQNRAAAQIRFLQPSRHRMELGKKCGPFQKRETSTNGGNGFFGFGKEKRPINWYTTKTGSIRGGCNRRCNFCQRRASVAKPTPDIGLWLTAFPKIDAIDFRPSVAQLRDREKGGETCGGVSVLVCVSWSTHPMKINCPSSSGICTGQIHYSRSRSYFSLGRVRKVIL